jgi:hypothetical protein
MLKRNSNCGVLFPALLSMVDPGGSRQDPDMMANCRSMLSAAPFGQVW